MTVPTKQQRVSKNQQITMSKNQQTNKQKRLKTTVKNYSVKTNTKNK